MPTELGEPYSPLWRGRYPHMLDEDRPVWDKYLDQHASEFERIYYDVRVGGIYPGPEMGDEKARKMYYNVTAKRIDALAETKNEVWIIEVSAKPGFRVIGQIMSYVALWFEDPKINKPAVPVLVVPTMDSDLAKALEFYGVRTRLVS